MGKIIADSLSNVNSYLPVGSNTHEMFIGLCAARLHTSPPGSGRRLGLRDRQNKSKRAALANRAVHPDAALHHFDQLLGDGKPQPGPAVLACGRAVGLAELVKDDVLVLRFDADARVDYGRPDDGFTALVLDLDANRDAALFCELDGVAQQIRDDLLEAHRIGLDRREIL